MNYKSFFRLSGSLFSSSKPLFLSEHHDQAVKRFNYITDINGSALITGYIGSGKTYSILKFLESLDNKYHKKIYLSLYDLNPVMLASLIGNEFDFYNCFWITTIMNHIINSVRKNSEKRIKTIFVFDNIHNLSIKSLEFIKNLIENLELYRCCFFLVGSETVIPKIKTPSLKQLSVRLVIEYYFRNLSEVETISYIKLRLAEVELSIDIFDDKALKAIYLVTLGNPRAINTLIGSCFLVGESKSQKIINSEIVYLAKDISFTD